MFLQIGESALKANPWNPLGYGILVAVLIVAVGALWLKLQQGEKKLEAEQKKDQENFIKVTEIMTKFLLTFEEDRHLREEVREVIIQLKYAKESLTEKSRVLESVEKKVNIIYQRINDKMNKDNGG